MTVVDKDIASNRKLFGQFLTPLDAAKFCIDHIETNADLIIEPSCGEGVFLNLLKNKFKKANIIGREIDPELVKKYNGEIEIGNFYDYQELPNCKKVAFIGNPPYRSPALSLKSHEKYINWLRTEYNIQGIREESVLFILHTFHLIKKHNIDGEAHYILPKAIFKNNSKVFTKFADFLNINFGIRAVYDIGHEFDSVARNLIFVSMTLGPKSKTINLNNKLIQTEDWLCAGKDIIPFQKIFKKTYLGSVPCESIFLSCAGESKEDFISRLTNLFSSKSENIIELLSYKGQPHLRALRKGNLAKIEIVKNYIEETKNLISIDDFSDEKFYKPIKHRYENRWYFRHEVLKSASFVYQLNPNPCSSFSFPGNPSSSSKDYFIYCEYDINRNSGPGAQRLVPIENLENNLTDWFKDYWVSNTKLPFQKVLDYLQWIGESEWYKNTKKNNERFYFGIPIIFQEKYHAREKRSDCGRDS